MDGDGRFLALRVDLTANLGAYISQYGPFIPYIGATMSTGVYDIQALDVEIAGVYTNTCPVDAYRGAGGRRRPSCSKSWSTPARATSASAARRNPPPQLHQAGAVSLPHRRPTGSTTSANSTAT